MGCKAGGREVSLVESGESLQRGQDVVDVIIVSLLRLQGGAKHLLACDPLSTLTASGVPSTHLLQQLLHRVGEAVRHLVDELRAGDVHAVHDGVLLRAQDAVGLAARLQHVHLDVLLHHQPDLLQQGVQVLLHAAGAVDVQVEVLWDLQQVGHFLRVGLVLRWREGREVRRATGVGWCRLQVDMVVVPWTAAWAEP